MLLFLNSILLACLLLASSAAMSDSAAESIEPSPQTTTKLLPNSTTKLLPISQLYDFGFTSISRKPCENFYHFVCDDPLGRYPGNKLEKRYDQNLKVLSADIKKSPENYHPPIGAAYAHVEAACSDSFNFTAEHLTRIRELFDRANRTHLSLTDLMLKVAPLALFYSVNPAKTIQISINYNALSTNVSEKMRAAIPDLFVKSQNISQFLNTTIANETQNDTIQTTVGELQNGFTAVDWIQYFTKILPKEVHRNLTEAGMTVANLPVVVPNLQVLKAYDNALKSLTYDQIVSAAAMTFITYENFWSKCSAFKVLFYDFISRVYADKYYANRTVIRQTVLDMAENIRREFAAQINASRWMNATGKAAALRKLSLIKIHIGAHDTLFNDSALMELYSNMNATDILATKSPLEIYQKLTHLIYNWLYANYLPSGRLNFMQEQAMYNRMTNEILISNKLLDEPFFGVDRPLASNYGIIGFVLAHEIGHALQSTPDGFEYLKYNETVFQQRVKCLSTQYENYRLYDMALNASNDVLKEHLADHYGFPVAYSVFKRLLTEDPRRGEPRIRGFEHLDADQQFFYSYAMFFCEEIDESRFTLLLAKLNHPPPQARVNIPLINSKAFGAAFKCPLESAMNPVEKCPLIF